MEAQARECMDRLSLAERLTMGLASENDRWGQEIDNLRTVEVTIVGDVLLSAAFVSYAGAFSSNFRLALWKDVWIPDLQVGPRGTDTTYTLPRHYNHGTTTPPHTHPTRHHVTTIPLHLITCRAARFL